MKTTKRENKSGTVRYLHLAHNEWDPVKGRAVPRVLFTFGREDELDRDAIKRLVASLSKLLEPGEALAATGDDACYRAMDWLHEVKDDLEKQVFDEVANLLNLEVDLLFFG